MTYEHGQQPHQHVRTHAGESAPFHFENRWRVNARLADVWSVLSEIESWPQWWPGLPVAVPADDEIVPGSRADIQVDSPIGVTLSFGIELQDTDPPNFVMFSAAGDLRGTGVWSLQQTPDYHDQLRVVRDHPAHVHSHDASRGNVDALTCDERRAPRFGRTTQPSHVLKLTRHRCRRSRTSDARTPVPRRAAAARSERSEPPTCSG